MSRMPSKKRIEAAKREIEEENKRSRAMRQSALTMARENMHRSELPSEHPDHIHGMLCDGQDGMNSYCERLREKLGYRR